MKSWKLLADVLKTSWRHFRDVWWRWIYWSWSRTLKKPPKDIWLTRIYSPSWRRLEDLFMKMNVCWDRCGINKPRPRQVHKYTKYKICHSMMIFICIKKHLSSVWTSIQEKVKEHLGWVRKKSITYKKSVYHDFLTWYYFESRWCYWLFDMLNGVTYTKAEIQSAAPHLVELLIRKFLEGFSTITYQLFSRNSYG